MVELDWQADIWVAVLSRLPEPPKGGNWMVTNTVPQSLTLDLMKAARYATREEALATATALQLPPDRTSPERPHPDYRQNYHRLAMKLTNSQKQRILRTLALERFNLRKDTPLWMVADMYEDVGEPDKAAVIRDPIHRRKL